MLIHRVDVVLFRSFARLVGFVERHQARQGATLVVVRIEDVVVEQGVRWKEHRCG